MMTLSLRVFDLFDRGIEADLDEVFTRLRRTDHQGFNSLELSRPESAWPMLSILINDEWCVMHYTDAKDGELYTLTRCCTTDAPSEMPVRYANVITTFTREYINNLATAEKFIRAFAVGDAWPNVPKWVEL